MQPFLNSSERLTTHLGVIKIWRWYLKRLRIIALTNKHKHTHKQTLLKSENNTTFATLSVWDELGTSWRGGYDLTGGWSTPSCHFPVGHVHYRRVPYNSRRRVKLMNAWFPGDIVSTAFTRWWSAMRCHVSLHSATLPL